MTTPASLALSLQTSESFSVLYVIIPLSIMSLASPVLRQICTAIKRTLQGFSSTRLHVQFVPENAVLGFVAANAGFEHLCFSVYDRILRPVDREMSRPVLGKGEQIRNYFQQPSHTLARPIYTTVSYRHQTPAPTLDVVDRYTLLHIAYQVTSCGKWVLAAIVDQRGESRDVGIWSFDSTSGERGLVELVWMFVLRFGKRANVEWRIAIAKLGRMSARELEGMAFPIGREIIFEPSVQPG
jgi:mediator of RNA polymerase II transcription subunit 13